MGEALTGRVDHLTGVDLSPVMIEKARERGLYDSLAVGDATALLRRQATAFDLIVAADSIVYIGDLAPLFAAAAAALNADGLMAFSVETTEEGVELGSSMRFAHSRAYIEATACAAGLRPLLIRSASTRREAGRDAPGLICVLERAEQQARA
jgi:predicted TPR repeat methyltransferase